MLCKVLEETKSGSKSNFAPRNLFLSIKNAELYQVLLGQIWAHFIKVMDVDAADKTFLHCVQYTNLTGGFPNCLNGRLCSLQHCVMITLVCNQI